MKATLYFLIILFLFTACSEENGRQESERSYTDLSFIGLDDTLYLAYRDEKCGEWGGNSFSLAVFRKEGSFYMDMEEFRMDCDSIDYYLQHGYANQSVKQNVQLDSNQVNELSGIIEEFMKLKLHENGNDIGGHSGAFSGIRTSDNELTIKMFPSPNWPSFLRYFSKYSNKPSQKYKNSV